MINEVNSRFKLGLLISIPIAAAFLVWMTCLSFCPVPWPDDSAFYFAAKSLFSWPPRWVMLPQAPFEPTYRIFNFNTMPLYPILIGLGRWIGMDGSYLLKFWPLLAWALTGSYLVSQLYTRKLPFVQILIWVLAFSLDPELRWASVLIRPESLVGLFGVILLSELTFGFSPAFDKKKIGWDPIAFLLALAAYSHFNAIHLVLPVIVAFANQPKRLIQIGATTLLYLSPWLVCVILYWNIFKIQMVLQWSRLAIPNTWLQSANSALEGLFQSLGNPSPYSKVIQLASFEMWVIILGAAIAVILSVTPILIKHPLKFLKSVHPNISILPASSWIFSSLWLWHTKPEVWFVYYVHLSIWFFMGVLLFKFWNPHRQFSLNSISFLILSSLSSLGCIFFYVNLQQWTELEKSKTWRWDTYYSLLDCVEEKLSELHQIKGIHQPFQVWNPTFPDVTVELSRIHPDWTFTRTNDFWERRSLAVQHGLEVDAIVIPETFTDTEQDLSTAIDPSTTSQSRWINWKEYFLNPLLYYPNWKLNRYLCQRGKWQAFLFMKTPLELRLQKNQTSPVTQ